jgi:predicted nucleotidyltransferase
MLPNTDSVTLAGYRVTARQREEQRQKHNQQRREAAWAVARQAAALLKKQFAAQRIIAYGSLVHGHWFHARSDIDLAVDGIAPAQFWSAWAALDPLAAGFEINLIALETSTPALRSVIEREGVNL